MAALRKNGQGHQQVPEASLSTGMPRVLIDAPKPYGVDRTTYDPIKDFDERLGSCVRWAVRRDLLYDSSDKRTNNMFGKKGIFFPVFIK